MIEQKSLMENIKEKYGEEVSNEIKDMVYSSNLYVLYQISVHKLEKIDFDAEFASWQVRYPDRTFERYMNFKKSWDQDKYSFGIEPQGYFIDEETACDYAKDNMGDINEAGCFPYAVVSSVPLNRVYPTCNFCTHKIFKYNHEKDEYEEISWDASEDVQILKKYFI